EPWRDTAERWRRIEAFGFDSAWIFDHFMAHDPHAADHTWLEAWTALAGLAAVTERMRIGILVSGNTYRPPALLAKEAVTVDQISGGRLALGLGAGWHEPEHRAYGFDFPPPGERVARLAEAVAVIEALQREERASFAGRFYRLEEAPFAPKPVRGRLPLVIGTSGPKMLRLVARHADVWNMVGSPEEIAERGKLLLEACAAVGRDPAAIRWSAAAWPNKVGGDPLQSPEFYRDLVGRYREAGVSEVLCMWGRDTPVQTVERIAEVLPALRAG
ncbi:MAG: POSSIBLE OXIDOREDUCTASE, partial [uncultured Thermomicrobiales bacterium]